MARLLGLCCLLLPAAGLGPLPEDAAALVQQQVQRHTSEQGSSLLTRKGSGQMDDQASDEAAMAMGEEEAMMLAGERESRQAAAASARAQGRRAVDAEALASGDMVDRLTRKAKAARLELQQAQKLIAEARQKVKELSQENATAWSKLNRSMTKKEDYQRKAERIVAKQIEREGLRGKHLHLDTAAVMERLRTTGKIDTFGLWNTSNEKQHFWEKTWDILSNHILGLDKLMKNVYNATEYADHAKKYERYEKFYRAKAAAVHDEFVQEDAKLRKAENDAATAQAIIAESTSSKAKLSEQKRKLRKEMARMKAQRRKMDAKINKMRGMEDTAEPADEGDDAVPL